MKGILLHKILFFEVTQKGKHTIMEKDTIRKHQTCQLYLNLWGTELIAKSTVAQV